MFGDGALGLVKGRNNGPHATQALERVDSYLIAEMLDTKIKTVK